MAVMQILEPGQRPSPQRQRLALGIDLGTTNSLVARVRDGRAEPLPDADGNLLLPSAVYYGGDSVLTGREALARAGEHPQDTLQSFKRMMGRGSGDLSHSEYRVVESDRGMLRFVTSAGEVSPVQASAEILRTLAERGSGEAAVEGVVITVPASFD